MPPTTFYLGFACELPGAPAYLRLAAGSDVERHTSTVGSSSALITVKSQTVQTEICIDGILLLQLLTSLIVCC